MCFNFQQNFVLANYEERACVMCFRADEAFKISKSELAKLKAKSLTMG